jgi:hypothetical protein
MDIYIYMQKPREKGKLRIPDAFCRFVGEHARQ